MRGTILGFDQLSGEGTISGDNGERATFRGAEWKSTLSQLRPGSLVDYEVSDGKAVNIYAVPGGSHAGADEKSNIVAGLLALFLGPLGIHKFYLGYTREGTILLVATLISWMLVIILIGFIGIIVTGIISLVEAVIYLTTPQDKFTATYVEGHKSWF